MPVLGWRRVPVNNASLGDSAKATEPIIEQVFFEENDDNENMRFELQCYVLRKIISADVRSQGKITLWAVVWPGFASPCNI